MKLFTEKDVDSTGSIPRLHADTNDLSYLPPEWLARGLQQTASGYGAKLNSGYFVRFEGKAYRVYTTCFSNAASNWFIAKGRKIFIS